MSERERKEGQSNDDKKLLAEELKHAIQDRMDDRSIILSSDEREMMRLLLRYFAAESKTEREAVERSTERFWDRGQIMELLDRLERLEKSNR